MEKKLVTSIVVLKGLEKAGYITLLPHTGKTVTSPFGDCIAWYIDDYQSRSFTHSYTGRTFVVEYVSGCFNPFVFELIN